MTLAMNVLFAALLVAADVPAPAPASAPVPGSQLTVSMLTFGPGDHPFFKFGHNAIWIRDKQAQTDKVYNFGTFYFDSPLLIPKFLKGLLPYWLSVDPLGLTISLYRQENRTVDAQELALTNEEKLELQRALELNALPENRVYRYDYYMDNCSTRVRDAIDRVIGGALRATATAPVGETFRSHTRRLTQDDLPEYLALDIVMGDFIDKPITLWEEQFLPIKVYEGVQRVVLHRPEGDVPLVKSQRALALAPGRAPPPAAAPKWHVWFFLTGVIAAAVWAASGRFHDRRAGRFGLGLGLGLGGIFGLLGCIFMMFWVATDHRVAHHNENIMQCAPFAVVLLGLMRGVRRRSHAKMDRALKIAIGSVALSVIGLCAKVLPMADQVNGEWICFFLPYWIGITLGLFFALSARQRSGA
ncbi:MAG: DUF4105 domain-containing protein [Deltaproteobacteria bacterium]|nr:DUF4105 domain-containing protein [Deltaproteobacteria bacterium]